MRRLGWVLLGFAEQARGRWLCTTGRHNLVDHAYRWTPATGFTDHRRVCTRCRFDPEGRYQPPEAAP